MTHSRRTMLKAAALAGPALFIPASLLDARERPMPLGVDGQPMRAPREAITRSLLGGAVGSDFTARMQSGFEVPLRLVAVEDLAEAKAARQEGSEESFSARFESTSGAFLSQGTYTLDHDWLGQMSMFLVPVGRPISKSQTYEAVFNNAAGYRSKGVMPSGPVKGVSPAPRRRGEPAPVPEGAVKRERYRSDDES